MATSEQSHLRLVSERIDEVVQTAKGQLKSGDGGGTFEGMEPRVAKLEASVAHIERDIGDIKSDVRGLRSDARTDFRLLFGALIAVALGLAGLMARGFGWL